MIWIRRGGEPPKLTQSRRTQLAAALRTWAGGATPKVESGYQVARPYLWAVQRHKCAYCERPERLAQQPVEHFRPKNGADRDNEPRDQHRYWWLAWTWENLYFVCSSCNSQRFKGNWFPLEPQSQPLPLPPRTGVGDLPAECLNLNAEARLLVDPAREDPLDHIRWKPKNPSDAPGDQDWEPYHLSPRGLRTIQILGLNDEADGLEDQVTRHLRCHVWPQVKPLLAQVAAGADPAAVRADWRILRGNFLDRGCPFVAAAWCALDTWVPEATRQQHGLTLPRP